METLTHTSFFGLLLGRGTASQQLATLESTYKDFVRSVMDVCMAHAKLPAFFSLSYARIEFAQLLSDKMTSGSKKK